VLIRTWNLFHGNTKPTQRHAFLEELVHLAVADDPDVVALQELPAWALGHVGEWSGYTAVPALAERPTIGPLPSTAEIGRVLTSLNNGVLRSAFSGQGNAIVVRPGLRVVEEHVVVLNPRRFRRAQAEWLDLGLLARLGWAKERRVCQVVRIADGDRTIVAANLHATSFPPDERLADAELLRAFTYVDGIARPGEPVAVAGDFNVTYARSRTLHDVAGPEWGFSKAGPGIDQVLVRNFTLESGPDRWPNERRTGHGALLSDHAPVEVVVS
jgi:endonuclease/exonuclease/phosphatase family metal-dependent hydrolase